MRHFNIIAYTPFDDPSMQRIFQTILDWWLAKEGFDMGFLKLSAPIIAATMDMYKASMVNLLPTPSKSHYTFNLRDFARVVQGMLLSNSADFEKTCARPAPPRTPPRNACADSVRARPTSRGRPHPAPTRARLPSRCVQRCVHH